jgi:hypothetical protein
MTWEEDAERNIKGLIWQNRWYGCYNRDLGYSSKHAGRACGMRDHFTVAMVMLDKEFKTRMV